MKSRKEQVGHCSLIYTTPCRRETITKTFDQTPEIYICTGTCTDIRTNIRTGLRTNIRTGICINYDVPPAAGRFPGWTDGPAGKGPWEVTDPTCLLTELNRAQFPPDIGLRVRSCAALKSNQKVHGAEKMADQINLLSTGLIKIMARTLPPLQRVAIGKISDACAGFWKVQFTVGEGKRYEKLMLEGLCLLERGFPSYQIHTTIFHYCVHIAPHWKKFGPPRLCNCFVFERHIGAMVSTRSKAGAST